MSYKKDMSKYEHLEGWERCGFGEQLDKWAEKYGERTAVTDSEDEISYMELKQKADCLAAAFLRKKAAAEKQLRNESDAEIWNRGASSGRILPADKSAVFAALLPV